MGGGGGVMYIYKGSSTIVTTVPGTMLYISYTLTLLIFTNPHFTDKVNKAERSEIRGPQLSRGRT